MGSESDDEDESSSFSNLSPEEMKARERANKDKGTAGKETEAGAEISALVNYVQPIHFHSFEHAERTSLVPLVASERCIQMLFLCPIA